MHGGPKSLHYLSSRETLTRLLFINFAALHTFRVKVALPLAFIEKGCVYAVFAVVLLFEGRNTHVRFLSCKFRAHLLDVKEFSLEFDRLGIFYLAVNLLVC